MNNILHNIIRYAAMAPSDHNTQPWKFRISGQSIYIYPDYSRLKHAGADQSLFISLGCALENLVIAANHFNLKETVHYNLDLPDEHIRIDLESFVPVDKDCTLFAQLDKRQVTRGDYSDTLIPTDHLLDLLLTCKDPNIYLKFFIEEKEKTNLLPFVEEAIRRQSKKEQYKKSMTEWVRFNTKEAFIKKDGIIGNTIGLPSTPTWFGKFMLSSSMKPQSQVDLYRRQILSAPAIMMFIALKQDKTTLVNLGRCYERIALKATSLGIRHAHINMVCEDLEVRRKLKQELGYSVEEPLMMIRLGYAEPESKSYRRELKDIIVQ